MSGIADFYFVAWRRARTKSDRRVDGYFLIPQKAFACEACSGSSGLFSLPEGRYVANNFRERSEAVMTRDGVGFSVDLSDKYDPAAKKVRSLLRIHPDGGQPGTEGCIGILSRVAACRDHLKAMLPDNKTNRTLVVVRSPDKRLLSLVVALLKTVVAD